MRINKSLITYQPASGAGSGTVTSVALSAPTGFTVSGSPVTTSGTLTLAFTTGYGIPPLITGNSGRFLTTNGTTMSWVDIAGTDVTGAAISTSNDTNILITASGNTTNALLRTLTLTTGWTGQLAVGRGGTGASTLTGVVIGNATSAMTAVAGTAGQFLRRNTANTAYEFRTLQGGDIAGSELTFTNDTNVQMTLGGTPASALLQPVSINLGWTGQLAVSRGGTGAGTLTGVLIGNGTSAVTAITGTANQILRRNSGNTAYEFWSANYMTNPMTLEGSIIYAATGGTPTELFANNTSTNKYLRSVNGTAPTWEALPASVGGSGTTNYVSKWTASTTLGNSLIYDNGTNVGIGTTTTQTKLTTYDSANLFSASFGGASSTPNVVALGTVSSTPTINGYSYDFGLTSTLQLQSHGGNVGIGTPTPAYKFVVSNSSTVGMEFDPGTIVSGRNRIISYNRSTSVYNDFEIYANNVILSPSANVGIGTATPTHKLEVVGVISAGNASATIGSIILQDTYSAGHLGNIGTMFSSGNFMLGYAVTPSTSSATSFLSSAFVSGVDFSRSSITLGENVSIYTGAAQSVAIGSSVTMSEKLRLLNSGQLRLLNYTSTSSFSGLTVGLLGFTSTGAITTYTIPGGVSGTQDYLAKFDSTGVAVANSRIVDNGTNFLLNSASAYVTGLNLIGDIGIQSASSQASSILMRSNQTPTSGTTIGIIDSYAITTGSTYQIGGGIEFRASQNWNSTSAGTNIFVQTAPDNTIAPADMFVFLNNGAVRFIGRTSNPIGAAAGTMYYNNSANNMRYYNGTSWITF